MKTGTLLTLSGLLLVLSAAARLHSQETLLGIGWIQSSGALVNGACPVGTMTTSRPATGEFHVTIDAPGQFAGAGIGDFLPQATTRIGIASDRALTAEIASVSDDSVTAVFYLSDLEDSANLSGPDPVNYSFQFAVHRFPRVGAPLPKATRHLFAAGSVEDDGSLKGAVTSDGSTLQVARLAEGDFSLTFTKAGGFADVGLEDFFPFATTDHPISDVDNHTVGTASSKSADHVTITFNTSDVQNPTDVDPMDEDNDFHFTIYRTSQPAAAPESALLLAMASVQGNGLLRRGATSIPGGVLTVDRLGPGRYFFALEAPGAFAGREVEDFSVNAFLNNGAHIDRIPSILVHSVHPDTLKFNVRVKDVENDGEFSGVLEDNDFFVIVHEAFATARPDLRIGAGPSLGGMKGNNRYNTSAAGQRLRSPMRKSGALRFHFAAENDGNTSNSLRVRGRAGRGLKAVRYFRLTGGRKNVTADCRAAGHLADSLRPGTNLRYEVRATLPESSRQRRAQVRILALPGSGASPADANLAWCRKRRS